MTTVDEPPTAVEPQANEHTDGPTAPPLAAGPQASHVSAVMTPDLLNITEAAARYVAITRRAEEHSAHFKAWRASTVAQMRGRGATWKEITELVEKSGGRMSETTARELTAEALKRRRAAAQQQTSAE